MVSIYPWASGTVRVNSGGDMRIRHEDDKEIHVTCKPVVRKTSVLVLALLFKLDI